MGSFTLCRAMEQRPICGLLTPLKRSRAGVSVAEGFNPYRMLSTKFGVRTGWVMAASFTKKFGYGGLPISAQLLLIATLGS